MVSAGSRAETNLISGDQAFEMFSNNTKIILADECCFPEFYRFFPSSARKPSNPAALVHLGTLMADVIWRSSVVIATCRCDYGD